MNIGEFDELFKILFTNNSIEFFEEKLALNQNDANAWLGRAFFLEKQGNNSDAIQNYTRAIKLGLTENELFMALIGRTHIYYNLGEFQKALDDCEQALKINSNEVALWKTKGVLLVHLDEHFKALEAFEKGLSINPSNIKLIDLRDKLAETLQQNIIENLEKLENEISVDILESLVAELKDYSKYDYSERLKSKEFLDEMIGETITNYLDIFEVGFKKLSRISQLLDTQVDDKISTSYYRIKAFILGLKAIYPIYDQDKVEESRNFFAKAIEFAQKSNDSRKLRIIISNQEKLEERNNYQLNEIKKEKQSQKSLKYKAFGIGAFGIVLLFSGQWLIGLICIIVAFFMWRVAF